MSSLVDTSVHANNSVAYIATSVYPLPNSATSGYSFYNNTKVRTYKGQRGFDLGKLVNHPSGIPSMTTHCKRWGVVMTIADPTEAIVRVINMRSWCLVIIPDERTPRDYMEKLTVLCKQLKKQSNETNINIEQNVFFFSLDKQREWQQIKGPFGSFVTSIPRNSFSRKNIGYLFAILHGAEFIFDFDDDNFIKIDDNGDPLEILPEQDSENNNTIMLKDVSVVMQGLNTFNHHPIMGASIPDSWPRGFPMDLIQNNNTWGHIAYQTDIPFDSSGKRIGVIQFVADGNPDIDAIHRLSKPLLVTFSFESAKPVLVPTHSYSPYNAKATIHTQYALWATLLPSTVPGRVSDIWRSYISQCIFADTRLRIIFAPPKVIQKLNDHDCLGDFNAEKDLYMKSGMMIDFLSKWDSIYNTIPERMESLWIDLYEHGYIELDDVFYVQKWLGALIQIGFQFPELKPRIKNIALMGQFNYADKPSTINDVIFWTQKNREHFKTIIAAGPFTPDQMHNLSAHSIDAISNHNDTNGNLIQPGYYTPLENLKNVLLNYKDSSGIEGILYAHDDLILNVTELSESKFSFPSTSIIMVGNDDRKPDRVFGDGHVENFDRTQSFASVHEMYPDNHWMHLRTPYCASGITSLAQDPASSIYRETDGSIIFFWGGQSDALFIPITVADEFARAAELILKHRIFIECAMHTVIDKVLKRSNISIRYVQLCTDWDKRIRSHWIIKRGTNEMVENCLGQNKSFAFIHPYKLSVHGYREYDVTYEKLQ